MANQVAPAAGITINTFGSATDSTAVEREISRRLQQETQASTYFDRFTGEINKYDKVPDAIVVKKTDLTPGGDSLVIPMKMNINPTRIFGDEVLLGQEAKQILQNLEVKINQWREAVAGPAGNANHRIAYLNLLMKMREDIGRAVARDIDADHFRSLCEGFSENLTITTASGGLGIAKTAHKYMFGVGQSVTPVSTFASLEVWVNSSTGTIATTDILDLNAIDAIKARAKTLRLMPVFTGGEFWFVLLCHQNVINTIQTGDSNAWRAGVETADVRGKDNPFFTGAVFAYNGIIIHEHPDTPSAIDDGSGGVVFGYEDSNTDVIKTSFLLGQGPICFAEGSPMRFIPENYDFMNQQMVGISQINGLARSDFKVDDGSADFHHQGSALLFSYADDPVL